MCEDIVEKGNDTQPVDLTADPDFLSLEAIPEYVKAVGKRWGVDAWLIGKALERAKKLVQEAYRAGRSSDGWRSWCEQRLGFSHETARKWIKVAERFASKDKLEGLTLEEAYFATGGKKTRKIETSKKEAKTTDDKPLDSPPISTQGEVVNEHWGDLESKTAENEEDWGDLGSKTDENKEDWGDGPVVKSIRDVTPTTVEESDDEDWGDNGNDAPDDEAGEGEFIEELLDSSFNHLDGVRRATTLADAKQAANLAYNCLVRLRQLCTSQIADNLPMD